MDAFYTYLKREDWGGGVCVCAYGFREGGHYEQEHPKLMFKNFKLVAHVLPSLMKNMCTYSIMNLRLDIL